MQDLEGIACASLDRVSHLLDGCLLYLDGGAGEALAANVGVDDLLNKGVINICALENVSRRYVPIAVLDLSLCYPLSHFLLDYTTTLHDNPACIPRDAAAHHLLAGLNDYRVVVVTTKLLTEIHAYLIKVHQVRQGMAGTSMCSVSSNACLTHPDMF